MDNKQEILKELDVMIKNRVSEQDLLNFLQSNGIPEVDCPLLIDEGRIRYLEVNAEDVKKIKEREIKRPVWLYIISMIGIIRLVLFILNRMQ